MSINVINNKGQNIVYLYRLLLFGHRSLIKNIIQTAVINIFVEKFIYKLDVSYVTTYIFKSIKPLKFEIGYIYKNKTELEEWVLKRKQ